MKERQCEMSRGIASRERLSEDDEQHLAACERCREFLVVQRALADLGSASDASHHMPPAGAVFVRAKILEKRRLAHEIGKPLQTFQKIANAILVVCWFGFVAIQGGPLLNWLSGLELTPLEGIASSGSLPLSFFWMFAALSVMTMMTMLHGQWTGQEYEV
ncbi:MAG: hypothetical protein R3338_01880 [Thermoanaerobaculia bacterium]|nr:hypothetical protein [Thermoanaerobaculia bacterium]